MKVMVDLETLDTKSTAAVISIGAVAFTNSEIVSEFYASINLESAMKYGTVDADTLIWWMKQSDEARADFWSDGKVTTEDALQQFSIWLKSWDEVELWGNGAAFDNTILSTKYQTVGLEVPWKFWNDRCYRTLKALYPNIKSVRTGTHHNALDDAKTQALHLMEILKEMK